MSTSVRVASIGRTRGQEVPPCIIGMYLDARGVTVVNQGAEEGTFGRLLDDPGSIVQVAWAAHGPVGILAARELVLDAPMEISIPDIEEPLRRRLKKIAYRSRFAWIDTIAISLSATDERSVVQTLLSGAQTSASGRGFTHLLAPESARVTESVVQPLGFKALWNCHTPVPIFVAHVAAH